MLVWPALVLMVLGVLLMAAISALRAAEIGQSQGLVFIAVILTAGLGPVVLLTLACLFFKPEVQSRSRASPGYDAWLWSLALLLAPWGILVFFGLGRSL